MPNEIGAEIKEAKFAKALVEHNGNATQAYKAISPNVTSESAAVLGSKLLRNIHRSSIEQTLKEIGATPDFVLGEALKRAKNSKKDAHFLNTAKFLAKVGGWDQPKKGLNLNIDGDSLEVIDVVRVRLKKKKPVEAEDAEVVESKE